MLLLARLAWSSFSWKGPPVGSQKSEDYDKYREDVEYATMKYVRDNGFGHEWWNFDERFCDHFILENLECSQEYYYGTVPRSDSGIPTNLRDKLKNRNDLIIFFISWDLDTGEMKFVGAYVNAEFFGTRYKVPIEENYKDQLVNFVKQSRLQQRIIQSFISEINKGLSITFRAPKDVSFVLPRNLMKPINQQEVFGGVIRQFVDVIDVTQTINYDRIIEILREIKNNAEDDDLERKIGELISRLESLKGEMEREERVETIPLESVEIRSSRQCQEVLCEMAQMLGYYCEQEYQLGGFRVDVAWKESQSKDVPPFLVFEICHSGDPWKDIVSLEENSRLYRAIPVLVVSPENLNKADSILKRSRKNDKIVLIDYKYLADIYVLLRKLCEKLDEYGLRNLLTHKIRDLVYELFKKLQESP